MKMLVFKARLEIILPTLVFKDAQLTVMVTHCQLIDIVLLPAQIQTLLIH